MSVLVAAAGAKFSIGAEMDGSDATLTATDFTSQTWVEVGGVTNLGQAGDVSSVIKSNHLSSLRTRKRKGVRDAGQMVVVSDFDSSDAGQIALVAAANTETSYAFKVEFNDAPAGGTPSIRYYVGFVMSAVEEINQADNVIALSTTIEIDSNIVHVAAASV